MRQVDGNYVPNSDHPVSNRRNVNANDVAGFLRGMARLMVLAAREVDEQRQLTPGPRIRHEAEIIEGEWTSR